MRASGAPTAIELRRCRWRLCRCRNDREHQRFSARCDRILPNLREEMLRVVLVHPGEFILPELGGKLGRYADKKVRARGVEIFSKSKVAAVMPREIELTNGEKIISSTLVWTAG